MVTKKDWNEELILQLFASVQYDDDLLKSFEWMSIENMYSSNIYKFARLLEL